MPNSTPERIQRLLQRLSHLNAARELFAELNYDVARDVLPRNGWKPEVREALAEDPQIIARHAAF